MERVFARRPVTSPYTRYVGGTRSGASRQRTNTSRLRKVLRSGSTQPDEKRQWLSTRNHNHTAMFDSGAPGVYAQPSSGSAPSYVPVEETGTDLPLFSGIGRNPAANGILMSAALNYTPTITPGGDPIPATAFGLTYVDRPQYHYANIHISQYGVNYFVLADVGQQIYWSVRSVLGWNNQADIRSSADPKIRAGNYMDVYRDLRPNASAKPPRNNYWAEDLTIKHEQQHITQLQRFTVEAIKEAKDKLNRTRVNNEAEIRAALDRALANIDAYVDAEAQRTDRNELEAYVDGAGDYRGRAKAIRARGQRGDYPP